jgi:hypothetical protein
MSPRSQPDPQTLTEINSTTFGLYTHNWIDRIRGKRIVKIPLINQVFETNISLWSLDNSYLAGTEFGYMTTSSSANFFMSTDANIQNGRSLMHMINERIFLSPPSYRVKRNSPYQTVISKWISRYWEAGLYKKFNWDSYYDAKQAIKY